MNNNPYYRAYMNPYQNIYNQQNMYDQIDNQIAQLNQMKEQMKNNSNQNQQQPAINQTFQLAPNNHGGIRYVDSIEDVGKETVFVDTPFFSKDLSVMWIKNSSGDIKAYELNEIIKKDEKDLQIDLLTAKINELEGMIKHEQSNTNVVEPEVPTNTTEPSESVGESVKTSKPTSVSRVSKSKKG